MRWLRRPGTSARAAAIAVSPSSSTARRAASCFASTRTASRKRSTRTTARTHLKMCQAGMRAHCAVVEYAWCRRSIGSERPWRPWRLEHYLSPQHTRSPLVDPSSLAHHTPLSHMILSSFPLHAPRRILSTSTSPPFRFMNSPPHPPHPPHPPRPPHPPHPHPPHPPHHPPHPQAKPC